MFIMDYPKPLDRNAKTLCRHLGLKEETKIATIISSFTIEIDGKAPVTTQVGPNKYKSAMLIYLMLTQSQHQNFSFQLTLQDRVTVIEYFGAELVADAITNPNTVHHTIRDLLACGVVTVSITPA